MLGPFDIDKLQWGCCWNCQHNPEKIMIFLLYICCFYFLVLSELASHVIDDILIQFIDWLYIQFPCCFMTFIPHVQFKVVIMGHSFHLEGPASILTVLTTSVACFSEYILCSPSFVKTETVYCLQNLRPYIRLQLWRNAHLNLLMSTNTCYAKPQSPYQPF